MSLTRAAEYVRRLDKELQHTSGHPCHLDLHTRNIILTPTGDPVLIDWVNGGLSDPAFDLATVIAFLGLREENRDHFLASYQESVGDLTQDGPVIPAVVSDEPRRRIRVVTDSVDGVHSLCITNRMSGCSAARLARLLWEQGVVGSNPTTPTSYK